jgi:hypothetical protein
MVNLTAPWKSPEPPSESTAAESESEPGEERADVSRSTDSESAESAVESRESEVSVREASRVVATEIYSNGLHHREVAEKYDVEIRAVTWLMKERGIGFAPRDQGDPPEVVKAFLESVIER